MQFGGTVDKRIGQSIDVHWPGDGWYKGTIKQYVPAEGKYEAEFEEESGVSFVYFTGREVDRWAAGACGSSSANKAAKSQLANSTHFRKQVGGRKRRARDEPMRLGRVEELLRFCHHALQG